MTTRLGIGGIFALALALSLLINGVGFTVGPPTPDTPLGVELGPTDASAISWRPAVIRYAQSPSLDVQMVYQARRRIVGPLQHYPVTGYPTKLRVLAKRTYSTQGANGWKYRWVYLESSAPGWNIWGMSMTVQYRYKPGRIEVVPGTKVCRTWSLIITVKKDDCLAEVDNIHDTITFKMDYIGSWSYLFGNVAVERGASLKVGADGYFGIPRYWP